MLEKVSLFHQSTHEEVLFNANRVGFLSQNSRILCPRPATLNSEIVFHRHFEELLFFRSKITEVKHT